MKYMNADPTQTHERWWSWSKIKRIGNCILECTAKMDAQTSHLLDETKIEIHETAVREAQFQALELLLSGNTGEKQRFIDTGKMPSTIQSTDQSLDSGI